MRILNISPYLPWPINSGGNAAQFSTLACLAEDHHFELIAPVYNQQQQEFAHVLQQKLSNVTINAVMLGQPNCQLPERTESSLTDRLVKSGKKVVRSSLQTLKQLKSLAENGRAEKSPTAISLAGSDASPATPYNPFTPLPWQIIEAVQKSLRNGHDLVQVEFCEMLSLGTILPADIPKLFVHHQLHWMYAQRWLENCTERAEYPGYLTRVMELQEIEFLRQFDGIVVFSSIDKELLRTRLHEPQTWVSPFPIPADVGLALETAPFNGSFTFVGSVDHFPNRQALEWVLAEIFPTILRHAPKAKLKVVGNWGTAFAADWPDTNVEYLGYVPDLNSVLRGSIMLVPLKIGSGIRTKIIAAMAQRVPVVSTSIGAEGLQCMFEQDVLIGDTTSEIVQQCLALACDAELYARVAESGHQAVLNSYSPSAVRAKRNEIYSDLSELVITKTAGPE